MQAKYYYRDGSTSDVIDFSKELHREDGPAEIADGIETWWHEGKIHREDGPAVIVSRHDDSFELPPDLVLIHPFCGPMEVWFSDGVVHRDGDLPAVSHEKEPGGPCIKLWVQEGKLHRVGRPAAEVYGECSWYQNGILHRLDGPAKENQEDKLFSWVINGQTYFESDQSSCSDYEIKSDQQEIIMSASKSDLLVLSKSANPAEKWLATMRLRHLENEKQAS